MNTIHYSAATGGFYHSDHHGPDEIPGDAVRITAARHAELMAGQAQGRAIVAGADGRPALTPLPAPDLAQLRAQASRAVRAETKRRILAVASTADQANDAYAMAAHALRLALQPDLPPPAEVTAALDHHARIKALRKAGRAIRAQIAAMPASNLACFDASADRLWPAPE